MAVSVSARPAIVDTPERDPAARGFTAARYPENPDDRDGEGVVSALDLCPDLPSDRHGGCLNTP
jgi:hypothetical protein